MINRYLLHKLPDICSFDHCYDIIINFGESKVTELTEFNNKAKLFYVNDNLLTEVEFKNLIKVSNIKKRLPKRRFVVEYGDMIWEIDVINNTYLSSYYRSQLIIAEIHTNTEIELPDFIIENLIMDVTNVPDFLDYHLAK